jgi:hypothetical protein
MSYHGFGATLRIESGASPRLFAGLFGGHLLMMVATVGAALPAGLAAVLLFSLCLSLSWNLGRWVFGLGASAVRAVSLDGMGRWWIECGDQPAVTVPPPRLVLVSRAGFCLRFRHPLGGARWSLMAADAIPAKAFRRLRVRLAFPQEALISP